LAIVVLFLAIAVLFWWLHKMDFCRAALRFCTLHPTREGDGPMTHTRWPRDFTHAALRRFYV
jgi:hypothetical protein